MAIEKGLFLHSSIRSFVRALGGAQEWAHEWESCLVARSCDEFLRLCLLKSGLFLRRRQEAEGARSRERASWGALSTFLVFLRDFLCVFEVGGGWFVFPNGGRARDDSVGAAKSGAIAGADSLPIGF